MANCKYLLLCSFNKWHITFRSALLKYKRFFVNGSAFWQIISSLLLINIIVMFDLQKRKPG
jgi:hypothetical protein